MLCDLETNCVALERVLEYIKGNPQEAAWRSEESFESAWPEKGCIDLVNYETRYRPGLDLVLRGISLKVDGQMKVGICKSTLDFIFLVSIANSYIFSYEKLVKNAKILIPIPNNRDHIFH